MVTKLLAGFAFLLGSAVASAATLNIKKDDSDAFRARVMTHFAENGWMLEQESPSLMSFQRHEDNTVGTAFRQAMLGGVGANSHYTLKIMFIPQGDDTKVVAQAAYHVNNAVGGGTGGIPANKKADAQLEAGLRSLYEEVVASGQQGQPAKPAAQVPEQTAEATP